MHKYLNRNGNSSVIGYSTTADSITVWFEKGGVYEYTYTSTGRANVEEMKSLAYAGAGLGSFINKFVRKAYSRKIA